ncbi:hypothetical protein ACFQ4L_10565 [Lapidilactobacillus mulanensis]|uniref:Uncharacterized protein n=1 Tax=Lapidilactobacillus mulanensis TaxID=2485999 RepID=A0ABW4DSN7_9LACO|nr:hypothetical protein [Lapidilactobacillus mulanensis]
MGLISFLFGNKKPEDKSKDNPVEKVDYFEKNREIDAKMTINNYPMAEINPNAIYPWSDNVVYNGEVTIGNIIMLWWLDKYWNRNRAIPLYFERNYVKDFGAERQRLLTLGYIEPSGQLTELGKIALSENFKFIEKHRNNWHTPEENAKNNELYHERIENYAKQDEVLGMADDAKKLRQEITEEKAYDKISRPYFAAEKLGKQGEPEKSIGILIPLLLKAKGKNRFLRALITERIAIDSRKLKQYSQEINVLESYINTEMGQYRYDEYKEKFLKRITKAQQLQNKK